MTGATDSLKARRRVIGRVSGHNPGPTLICIGSIHGNEPAGVDALERVCEELDVRRPALHGEFVALTGNVTALARRQRFLDFDLNRHWLPDRVTALRNGTPPAERSTEDTELLELLDIIDAAVADATGTVYCVDLHTTSGDSPPFATIGDTLRNRAFAMHAPAPIIVGLEEELDGTLLEFVNRLGHVTMGFEGGRHDDPKSVDYTEAVVWVAMAAAGVLVDPAEAQRIAAARALLRDAQAALPRVLEVRHRHPVEPGDGFAMRDGYASFQPVAKGDHLAEDRKGPIHAPESGRILMPLYQKQGEDGFFVVREFRPVWLSVSAILRRLHVDAFLRMLPGVRRDPDREGTLVINRGIARFYALEIFHLLGYRKRRVHDSVLVVSKR